MTNRADSRRFVSATAVLLLHLAVVSAFVVAIRVTPPTTVTQEIEVSFPPRTSLPITLPNVVPEHLLRPAMPKAVAPTISTSGPSFSTETPTPGAISGVGRALFGCDAANLDRLSPAARAACLRLPKARSHEASVRLGPPPDPNSPFTREIEQRFRQAQPINRPCPPGSYNDIRGLPCFGFDQEAPLLRGR